MNKMKQGNQYKKQGTQENNKELIDKGEQLVKEGADGFKYAEQKAIILPLKFTSFSNYIKQSRMEKIRYIKNKLKKNQMQDIDFI